MTTEQQATKKEGVAAEALKNAQEETKHAMLMIQTSTGITLEQVSAELRKKFPHVTAEMAARIYTEASRQLVLEKDRKNATKYFLQEKASGNWPDAYTMQRMFPRLLSTWQQAKEFQEELMKKYGENNHKLPKAEVAPPTVVALSTSKPTQPPAQIEPTASKTQVPQNINGSKTQPPQNITASVSTRVLKPPKTIADISEAVRSPLWRTFDVYSDDPRTEEILLEQVITGTFSPRQTMDDDYIKSLAESLKTEGQQRAILVTPKEGKLLTVSGECRVIAARRAGLTKLRGLIVHLTDEQAIALALAANLEHALPHLKLKDIEEAKAIQRLIKDYKWSQESAGAFLGKSQRWVSYRLNLLKAPEEVQKQVQEGQLKEGQVRHITQLPEPVQARVADKVVAEGLSSRETEQLVDDIKTHPEPAKVTPEEIDEMLARNREEISKSVPYEKPLQDGGLVPLHKDTKGIYFFANTCPACGNEHTININFEEGLAILTRPKDLSKSTATGGKAS